MGRGKSRIVGLPSMRCTATNRAGKPCGMWARVGSTVCHMHGGDIPVVERKSQVRLTLAQLLQGDPRHPWEVLLDAVHVADALMREARARVREGDELAPDDLTRLVEATTRAAALAKVSIDSRAVEQIAQQRQRHLDIEGEVVATAVRAAVNVLPLHPAWRDYAMQAALRQLAVEGGQPAPDLPDPPAIPLAIISHARPLAAGSELSGLDSPEDVRQPVRGEVVREEEGGDA
jgi:hypothetical protein